MDINNYKDMYYNPESDIWYTKEEVIKNICEIMNCTKDDAVSHIEYSQKHGILYDYNEYKRHFNEV